METRSKTAAAAAAAAARATGTMAAGGLAGLIGGILAGAKDPQLTQTFIRNIPKLISQNWKKSAIIDYVINLIATSAQLNPRLLRSVIIKFIYTHEVLNKSNKEQFNYGKSIGKNLKNLYTEYSRIPETGTGSTYKHIRSGVLKTSVIQPMIGKVFGGVGKLLTGKGVSFSMGRKVASRSPVRARRRAASRSRRRAASRSRGRSH